MKQNIKNNQAAGHLTDKYYSTILFPTDISGLISLVHSTYVNIWKDWFPATSSMANIQVIPSKNDATAKYFDGDEIQIPLLVDDIKEYLGKKILVENHFSNQEELDWDLWKASLVHEMIHEYTEKCVKMPTCDGLQLKHDLMAHNLLFIPLDKHSEKFYSAVHEKSSYFGMSPLRFANLIK